MCKKKDDKDPITIFTVRKQRFMDALLYKIQNDPYYQDVQVIITEYKSYLKMQHISHICLIMD